MPLYRISCHVSTSYDTLVVADDEAAARFAACEGAADHVRSHDVRVDGIDLVVSADDLHAREKNEEVFDGSEWVSATEWLDNQPEDDLPEEARARAYRLSVEAAGQQRLPVVPA